ncbi:MAG: hypothetical protein ACRYGR_04675 [Janthinobacterium lividum]
MKQDTIDYLSPLPADIKKELYYVSNDTSRYQLSKVTHDWRNFVHGLEIVYDTIVPDFDFKELGFSKLNLNNVRFLSTNSYFLLLKNPESDHLMGTIICLNPQLRTYRKISCPNISTLHTVTEDEDKNVYLIRLEKGFFQKQEKEYLITYLEGRELIQKFNTIEPIKSIFSRTINNYRRFESFDQDPSNIICASSDIHGFVIHQKNSHKISYFVNYNRAKHGSRGSKHCISAIISQTKHYKNMYISHVINSSDYKHSLYFKFLLSKFISSTDYFALLREHFVNNKLKDFFINLDPKAENILILLQLNDNHFEIKNFNYQLENIIPPSHHKNFLPKNFTLKDVMFYNRFFIMSGLFNINEDQEKGGLLVYDVNQSRLLAQDVHDFRIENMWLVNGQLFLKTFLAKSFQTQLFTTDIEQFLKSKLEKHENKKGID